MESNIDLDVSKIPKLVRQELLALAYAATADYFRQPGTMEKFEKWRLAKERNHTKQ